jgi:fumarate reductase subunit D
MIKRSNKPIFWSLFGAGGMLAALIGPMLVLITTILMPLRWAGFDADAMSYAHAQALASHPLGRIAIVAVIGLFLFHGMHRLYHTLHDFGLQITSAIKALCHGLAALGTLIALLLVVRIGG